MINFYDVILELRPGAEFSATDSEITAWHNANQTEPNKEEIQAKLNELQNAEPMRVLREERNRKLAQTDWRASSDLTLSSEWSTYRQALRDLPANSTPTLDSDGNLQNVNWPTEPT